MQIRIWRSQHSQSEKHHMKAIFSILGLLIVVAITGFLAKKQLSSVSEVTVKPQDRSQISVPVTTPGANAQQQSQQIQQQVKQSLEAAMQQPRPMPDDK
jgi:multidrug efflux pump subunit AcrB